MIEVSDPRNEWSFESSTAAGTGANDRVFSDKRVDFDAMRISELEADDAALQEQVRI